MKPEIPYSSRISIRCLVVVRWRNARRITFGGFCTACSILLDETEKTTNERRVESTRRRLGVLRPRSTSNDTISALRFCPKRLSLLLSPFLLVTVDTIFSFSFAPVYYRLAPSFSISFCSVARASETTRKGGRESGVAVRTRKTEREKSAQHRHLQFGSRSQPGERKMEKGRGFARVRRGSRIAGSERRSRERGPKGDAKETTKRSNAKMASERYSARDSRQFPAKLPGPCAHWPRAFLLSLRTISCYMSFFTVYVYVSHPFLLYCSLCVIYCNFITACFRIATTPYRWTLYEVAINLCLEVGRDREVYTIRIVSTLRYSSNISNGLLLIPKLDVQLIKLHSVPWTETGTVCFPVCYIYTMSLFSPVYKVRRGGLLAMRY